VDEGVKFPSFAAGIDLRWELGKQFPADVLSSKMSWKLLGIQAYDAGTHACIQHFLD